MGQCICVRGSQSGAVAAGAECTLSLQGPPELDFYSSGDWIV